MNSLNEFENALGEVIIITKLSEDNIDNKDVYTPLIKSSLVLMCAKLETFIEEILEEFLEELCTKKPLAKNLPPQIRFHHTKKIAEKLSETLKVDSRIEESRGFCANMSIIWNDEAEISSIEIDCKFNYGKHGEKEIIKLFNRIGINNVFDHVKVFTKLDSLTETDVLSPVDIKGVLNSITHIRNNILHEDAAPPLTHTQVQQYSDYLLQLSKQIDSLLHNHLDSILSTA